MGPDPQYRHPTRHTAVAIAIAIAAVAGCSTDGASTTGTDAAPTTTVEDTTTTRATTTTVEDTTTTRATTTTVAATTTTMATLPTPAAPPPPRAQEPVIELGMIEIPKLGVSKTMFEGITLNTLDRGPGHWPGTAMPGKIGNVVVGGHRTSHDRPFRHVDQLVAGDEIIFTTPEGRFVYRVTRTEVVTPDAIWIIDQTPAHTATLFACHPVGSTRERIIVFAELATD